MVYLKAVEAYGFKSFAERTTVEFDQGLTAIVGPNGSGKSNITDAIRWVLGEQSAKSLRGARMEDIIFSGTEKRQPLNYAEVTLKLDNSSGLIEADSKLNITRRLYRSGESEYFINQAKSRLKDITELFLDTGLGKESFSMISQGKVDEILNAKPEERRHLIEEAAGVLKYKKRKKETAAKLDETMLNLSRVNDIIFDLESRIEPLQMEAAIAEEYQALTQEMREADIQVTVTDIKTLKTDYVRLETEIGEFTEMIGLKQARADKLETAIKEMTHNRASLLTSQEELHQQRLMLSTSLERHQGRLSVLYEKQDNLTQTVTRQQKEMEKLATELEEVTAEAAELQQQEESLKIELKEIRTQERAYEKKLSELNRDVETLIETARDNYYQMLSEQTAAKNELKYIDKELEGLNHYFSSVSDEDKEAYERLSGERSHKLQVIGELEQQLISKRSAFKESLEQSRRQRERYSELDEQIRHAGRYIDKLKSKQQSLTAMQAEYQGFYQGVRLVLKEKLTGIHGAVAELVTIDRSYQTALDIALGGQLQSIITDDEKSARQAIQFLKERKGGRATFLPLTTIRPKKMSDAIRQKLQQHDGYIGILSDLITVENQYNAIISSLSGLVIIAEDISAANVLAKKVDYKYRIVTLDGNIVNPGGSMTGGSVNQPSILLKQKEELTNITDQLKQYGVQLKGLEDEFDGLKNKLTDSEFKTRTLQDEGETLAEEVQRMKSEYDAQNVKLFELKTHYEQHAERVAQQAELTDIKKQLDEIILLKQSELQKIENEINDYQRLKTDARSIEEEVTRSLNEVRGHRIVLEERQKHQHDKVETNLRRKAQVTQAMSDLESDDHSENLEETIQTLKLTIQEEQESLEAVIQQFDKDKTAGDELAVDLEAKQTDYNELLRQVSGLEQGIGDMKGQYSRIDVQLENLIYHLMEDYHMTFEAADELYEAPAHIEELRQRVKLTRRSIEELGPVNIGAIQQYKEVKSKYDFLSEQESDLISAKETLETIMNEMDDEVTTRFNQTFSQVQQNFASVFRELFGGGSGELKLNSDDSLTAGIDIMVEPPGKKRQHLTLLSGGERALTAVALLFAILKVRTAPFVILDEVEAALDEANVLRFGSYVRSLSTETQFIVITHRKGTMEAADRLYGVTMQNSGITQMVSVDLNELNHNDMEELTE
ncbi:chromosome segregation protein SMC [Macrococcus hajekii]|uniref:Chromosome partition protein Smc n=1 Tax=Macrococcus hajekii TaxID=198482 RepID=A0A4R6BN86_9STAP|nr:chromosome segregation protein SMC [Macrococcus hajekii]TDM03218.1 chromosome segregation protein SMC [Macrococcus hajekii]GGA96976.1 chromosome partition protein Smc [Macrococcus hajekii]